MAAACKAGWLGRIFTIACTADATSSAPHSVCVSLPCCHLQDYLETKRIAFPRFYFVAPADLLDILSKGSNPQAILRHLSKCFDNVHNLSFRKDERGEPTKVTYTLANRLQSPGLNLRTHNLCCGENQTCTHHALPTFNMSTSEAWRFCCYCDHQLCCMLL